MKIKKLILLSLATTIIFSCSTSSKFPRQQNTATVFNAEQQHLLDSILERGLDYEALYTIVGEIKPMSSVASFSFPIANTDSLKKTEGDVLDLRENQKYLDKIEQLQSLVSTLDYPDLKFVLIPYKWDYKGQRTIQLSVVRVSLLNSLLEKEASFFGQFGLVPGTDPAVVVTTIEGCDNYERLRGYGYMFGYPEYAVDFFVDATVIKEQTNKFVERNFFQIPSFTRNDGTFVYAYPKEHTPDKTDSTIYYRAVEVLDQYKEIRGGYLNADSTLQSVKLLNDFFSIEATK